MARAGSAPVTVRHPMSWHQPGLPPLAALSQGNYNTMQGSGLGNEASVPKFSYAPVGSYEAA
jgi:hypothetical protein